MVPKMVPTSRIRVVSTVPHNPKVARFRHGARHVRVVVSRLLPSRVVLYRDSIAHAVPTMNVTRIASGR
jgi:hypothetical protein